MLSFAIWDYISTETFSYLLLLLSSRIMDMD